SSRRRHTRCYRDWSSDVCSSDLELQWPSITKDVGNAKKIAGKDSGCACDGISKKGSSKLDALHPVILAIEDVYSALAIHRQCPEIGRASCRERGELWVE